MLQGIFSHPENGNSIAPKVVLFWLPHAAVIAAVLSYSLLYFFQINNSIIGSGKWAVAPSVSLLISAIVMASYVVLGIKSKKYRYIVFANSVFILGFYASCLFVAEYAIPFKTQPPFEYAREVYTKDEITLQRLMGRRLTIKDTHFRGAVHRETFNSLGWPDKERRPEDIGKRQIVFIGDSFLQVRSTHNAAWLVEERLKPVNKDIEVINLSQDDTDPVDYRFRFFGFAFDYKPAHIVIFICLANDLDINYEYTPYKHAQFYVSDHAILYMAGRTDRRVVRELIRLKNNNVLFTNKGELLNALRPLNLPLNELNFIYLAVTAHSNKSHGRPFPLEEHFPKLLAALCQLWQGRFIGAAPSLKARGAAKEDYRRYTAGYSLPKEKRLRYIAGIIAGNNNKSNSEEIVNRLSHLGGGFLEEFLQEPDMVYLSFPAIEKYVYNIPDYFEKPSAQGVTQAIDNYILLFKELQAEAERRNVGLTFVLIPEASSLDEEYYHFWLPMIDFREKLSIIHALGQELSARLPAVAHTIDLNNYKDEFNMGYWHLDGHWNDKGNDAAAAIVSSYLKTAVR
ncbi:MAG: SGNH/GDSL hydrolase family protein [Nitrospirae bacterium]|nr:SGNH/GDSL hydrolase family protein [Nitrospirota bacterium]